MDASAYSFGLRRVVAIGSVDDGKSTLIGRLLFDTGNVYADQLAAVQKSSQRKGKTEVDLSFITDGLAAEREQGITIDVAYRYFTTSTHRFILADAPGHEEYTRNMITGAANADTAVVLTDARLGPTVQTVRHLFLAQLFGVKQLIVAVNKMDDVGYDKTVFDRIQNSITDSLARISVRDVTFIPVCALRGDMVVERGGNLGWYAGPTLLAALEREPSVAPLADGVFRFSVQSAIRNSQDFRGYAGRIASGTIHVGDNITVLPSRRTSTVTRILLDPQECELAHAPQSVVLTFSEEIGVSRGDVIVRSDECAVHPPHIGDTLQAKVCWMSEYPLTEGATYMLKHGTRTLKGTVGRLHHRIDMRTISPVPADRLELNDVGSLHMVLHEPLVYDPYVENKTFGGFLIIDPLSKSTVGVGVIETPSADARI